MIDRLGHLLSSHKEIAAETAQQLLRFAGILERWNSTYRLIGSIEADALYEKHIYDALVMSQYLQGAGKVIDLGAGAGLPSIPLSILRPDLAVVLVEPQLKRVNFCNHARRELNIERIQVVRGRAEDESTVQQVAHCRWVLSRATWKLPEFLAIATPYHAESIIALKGERWHDELGSAADPLRVIPYQTPISKSPRNLLIFS